MSMRRLGIDYGSKRVGLALTDEPGGFAYPLVVLSNGPKLLAQIKAICRDEKVEEIVLGESLNFHRRQNPIMRAVLKFKLRLEGFTGLPVVFEDETLTTREASYELGRPARTKHVRSGKDAMLDARAAAIILRQYLEKIRLR